MKIRDTILEGQWDWRIIRKKINNTSEFKYWWIIDGKILGSGYPLPPDFKTLQALNVKTVIDLSDARERKEEFADLGMSYYYIPVKDMDIPAINQIREFIQIVKRRGGDGIILVHCLGGHGRTGTFGVAAVMNYFKHMNAKQAITYARERNKRAAEAEAQEEFLHKNEALIKKM
jgi:protein-tyrosine phosphatase